MSFFRKLRHQGRQQSCPGLAPSKKCVETLFSKNKTKNNAETRPNQLSCYYIGCDSDGHRVSYSNAQTVDFRSPEIRFRKAMIQEFPNLIDISALKSVNCVYLNLCHSLTDVSPLALAEEVVLHNCQGISEVNVLKDVPRLSFIYCHRISNIEDLNLVSSLNLNRCHQIKTIPEFKSAQRVTVWDCDGINAIDKIGKVGTLKLGVKLMTLPDLSQVDYLHLSKVNGSAIEDFSSFQQLQGLYLHGFNVDLEMSPNFVNLEDLTLSHCTVSFAAGTTNNLRTLKTIFPGCQVKFHCLPKLRHLQLGSHDYSDWDFSLLRLKTLVVERHSIKRFNGLMPLPNMLVNTQSCTVKHIKQLEELTDTTLITHYKVQGNITIYPQKIRDLLA